MVDKGRDLQCVMYLGVYIRESVQHCSTSLFSRRYKFPIHIKASIYTAKWVSKVHKEFIFFTLFESNYLHILSLNCLTQTIVIVNFHLCEIYQILKTKTKTKYYFKNVLFCPEYEGQCVNIFWNGWNVSLYANSLAEKNSVFSDVTLGTVIKVSQCFEIKVLPPSSGFKSEPSKSHKGGGCKWS